MTAGHTSMVADATIIGLLHLVFCTWYSALGLLHLVLDEPANRNPLTSVGRGRGPRRVSTIRSPPLKAELP